MMGNRGGRTARYDRDAGYRKRMQYYVQEHWSLAEIAKAEGRGRSNVWRDTLRARRDLYGTENLPPSATCRRCKQATVERMESKLCRACKHEDSVEEMWEGKR